MIGVTTAYYLAQGGAEVTVLDRQTGPGLETSYANAGELSYGMTSPWAAPGIPLKAIKWLLERPFAQTIGPLMCRRRTSRLAQIGRKNFVARCNHGQPSAQIFQLAHIAWKIMLR